MPVSHKQHRCIINCMNCIARVHCSNIQGPGGVKCIIYASLLFATLCIQDEWTGRWNALLWLPGVKGSRVKNLPRLLLFFLARARASSPRHASAVPHRLPAYLKVTRRRRRMCGLQPLKCPHEAKELFVSLEELQSPGWDRNGRLTPLSCFHHSRMTLCHRWGGTRLLHETRSAHERERKERQLL